LTYIKNVAKWILVFIIPNSLFDLLARIDPDEGRRLSPDKRVEKLSQRLSATIASRQEVSKGFKHKLETYHAKVAELRETKTRLTYELRDARKELIQKERSGLVLPGSDLRKTSYPPVESPVPYVNRHKQPKVLLLNSMGGSMGRYAASLQVHEGFTVDCIVGSFSPRPQMIAPHETNVFGVFNDGEWINFLKSSFAKYDFIQSTTFPLHKGIADCYKWINDSIGERHLWRATGFVHHFIERPDVLPVEEYSKYIKNPRGPGSHNYMCEDCFPIVNDCIDVGNFTALYSSPEKGVYLKGDNVRWLPGIRDENIFKPEEGKTFKSKNPLIYVPYHKNAVWKGLDVVIRELEALQAKGLKFQIVTSSNASKFFPDLATDSSQRKNAYPILPHNMPKLLARVDAVIDQIIMGSYGNTGLEAMLSGVPVVGQKKYPEISEAPICDVTPENFSDKFAEFLQNQNQWKKWGEQGREYAINHHSPQAVARTGRAIYEELHDRIIASR